MRKFTKVLVACSLSSFMHIGSLAAADAKTTGSIGVVNAQPCFTESKPALKTQQLIDSLVEKTNEAIKEFDKKVAEFDAKLNDQHYRDGLTPEADKQLKQGYEKALQDRDTARHQLQQQHSQTHVSLVQDLIAQVNQASEKVAKSKNLTVILSSDAITYFDPSIDQTNEIMKELDASSDLVPTPQKDVVSVPTPVTPPSSSQALGSGAK